MNLANDYFLLYHGSQVKKEISYEIMNIKEAEFYEVAALILSATRKNYEKYFPLKSFNKLCKIITDKTPTTINELYQLQYNLIEIISKNNNKDDIEKLHSTFEYLKNENILNNADNEKLISLFDPSELVVEEEKTNDVAIDNNLTFQEHKEDIDDTIKQLKELFNKEELKKELDETIDYINNQKFSIGITGVMNAGKSTMLNALMGKEILGSAVVPETANLTIVKYDKTPSANVFYWNKQEWEKIENSASDIKSIKEFIDETKSIFKDDLYNYIKEESRSESVDINNLAAFTSAEASGKKCNLVKYVELKSNLEFLEDGIEIVDTPGLDDPVIQREEITKEYLSTCDMMLHLMNVSQSATLKDVEFIIDALLYQNISKLLIVITRADTVSKEQLQEVIDYTKTSIKKQLKSLNKDSKLDYILKTIKFIPISGRMALLHRTGREEEALKAGFKIEDTGIIEIEDYLNDSLFGKNSSKSELIIKSAKTQIMRTIDKQTSALNYELRLLSKSKEELELELSEFNKKKSANEKIFQAMKEDILYYKDDTKNYIKSLQTFLSSELIELQTLIKQRVISDVRYTYEKEKKKPEEIRTKSIIQTAIKDGIIDVVRDYRYKFIKKSQSIGEICEQKYHDFGFIIGHNNDNFDARGFFQEDFKSGFLTTSNDILISKIVNAVNKSKSNRLEELDSKIEQFLKEEFINIEENITTKANEISQILIDNFFDALNAPLKNFEDRLKSDEEILQKQLKSFEENDKNRDTLSLQIHKNLKKLETIKEGCKK
ncbi:ATP-binding protein [Malaciobacter molluscorum LMG 25693]|uniref:ATP-binding protein n=1 Tax=Malaciobacter molluscorum LMG 25693 TaxID=870501 RepID=A0A2G1DHJ9_9BACT|nr:dynamin family protein [Malaciobacter molluscorum]AXX93309.1 GTP-binding protein (dynamin domain) [Malaciobacter molluscorum LMG 25693]PHO17965.1 ATP-binding protein [Malaciobacter molluscorum LMG 25693]